MLTTLQVIPIRTGVSQIDNSLDDGTLALGETDAEASLEAVAAPSSPTPSVRRATAFEELVRLEKDHRAGRIPATDYAGGA